MFTGRRCGLTSVISCPPMVIVPCVGSMKPAITRSRVVFPHPDGPRKVTNSPGGDLEVDAAQHLVATERVAHPANGQSAIAYLLAHSPTPISSARRSLRAARRVATAATTQSNIVIASSRVEATLIPGSTVRRRRPKM